jgi:CRP/FNR family transcriptional regulator, nitrogen oxide reductase regulator
MSPTDLKRVEGIVGLLSETTYFSELSPQCLYDVATRMRVEHFPKHARIFQANDPCRFFYLVAEGLARVSICSSEGHRLTYLLAVRGEALNLAGPFSDIPRAITAEAVTDTSLVLLERNYFNRLAFQNPDMFTTIINTMGNAVDSANSRILDMVGKNVDQRLQRILHTLHRKFGSPLAFTSTEIAEMICTTTESTLRALSKLRRRGILETGRRNIRILQPEALVQSDMETVWL